MTPPGFAMKSASFRRFVLPLRRAHPRVAKSQAERELASQQIISRAVVSTAIVDIMKAARIETPDISVLPDEFLAELRDRDEKNLALEALRKPINGEVHAQSQRNVVQSKLFSERLEAAIARYHANAITTVQVLEDLIHLAKTYGQRANAAKKLV
jgi:type I restriction enzyme R subunit